MRFHRRALLLIAACAAMIGGASQLSAQTVGSVRGNVVEGNTLRPLSGVQVTVPGTGRGALSDAAGNYLINNVPAGPRVVRAEMLGFATVDRPLAVMVSQTAVQDFQLSQVAVALNELVVTGVPGATSKRTLGNSITKLDVADLNQKTTTSNLAELLQSKTPGLQMIPNAGVPGTSSDIRIRGASSLSLSNAPIVFVDGVRYNTGGYGSFTPSGSGNQTYSGQATSALDGVDPNDIESIEVIKGPAAATLYGPEAAAGVIQVITKKGKIGQQSVQWNAKVEYGANQMALTIPDNITTCDQAKLAQPVTWPGCVGKPAGTQMVDNPLTRDPLAFRNGPVRSSTITARGGGDNFSYYIAGDFDDQNGVQYASEEIRKAVRANFQLAPTKSVDFSLSTNYTRTNLQLPLGDESAEGMLWSGFQGQPGHSPPGGLAIRQNWYGTAPVEVNQYNNQTKADRLTLGGTLNVRPWDWFRHRLTLGMDYTGSFAQVISAPGSVDASYAGYPAGIVAQRLPRYYLYNLDYSAMLDRRLTQDLLATTSFGAQYTYKLAEQTNATGYGFGAPAVTYIGTAQTVAASNSFSENKALGFFGQEQFGWKDRLYLTGALRVDNNSSFGANIHRYVYPKASLAWVASDEPMLRSYFDKVHVDNFKLRTAWGEAGSAPAPYAWNQTYTMDKMIMGTTTGSSLRTLAQGNPDLKPERGSEIELGFESGLFHDRGGIDFTYYRKDKSDVLISLSAPPSSGFGSSAYYTNQSVQQNLGETLNQGIELSLRASPVMTKLFSWDAQLVASTNSNKLVKFGNPLVTNLSIYGSYGTVQYHKAGYPLAGYWAPVPKYDAQGKLVVNSSGLAVGTDTSVYIGPSSPTRNLSFSSTFTVLRNFRLFANFDYAGGFYNYNYKEYNRCRNRGNCAQMNDPSIVDLTNLDWVGTYGAKAVPKNADLVALLRSNLIPGYWIQPGDFIKFRDLSLTYTVPNNLLRYGVRGLSLTGAMHNLGILWTRYGGIDPEGNGYGYASFSRSDVYELPETRRVTVSANVSF